MLTFDKNWLLNYKFSSFDKNFNNWLYRVKMGNHQTTLDLSRHWKVAIKNRCPKRSINLRLTNPFDEKKIDLHIRYKNPTNKLDDLRLAFRDGHSEGARLWEPKDHARDFEVVDGTKYARGQIIGMVVDEDVGVLFKLAWSRDPSKPFLPPYQFDLWNRNNQLAMDCLKESLGLGNVCLLIQNGLTTVLDDPEAVSEENCVFLPPSLVDPDLNDFRSAVKRTKTPDPQASSKRIKEEENF